MSKRMTDSNIAYDWRLVQNKTDATEQTSMAQTRLEEELKRARASEDQKDATIKALADALEHAEGAMVTALAGLDAASELKAALARIVALRLAGRL